MSCAIFSFSATVSVFMSSVLMKLWRISDTVSGRPNSRASARFAHFV